MNVTPWSHHLGSFPPIIVLALAQGEVTNDGGPATRDFYLPERKHLLVTLPQSTEKCFIPVGITLTQEELHWLVLRISTILV